MSVNIIYHEEKNLIELTVCDPWDMLELSKALDKINQYMDEATQPILFLTDVTQAQTMPVGILRHSKVAILKHPNSGYSAIVGAGLLVKRTAQVFMTLAQYKKYGFFETRKEAETHLEKLITGQDNLSYT